ncbi:MAG: tRNA (adenosine(37)-N6)-threonylcarbamoyltransferase complex ATPase subunit type 1 TsaE [Patescibacteria group bacterium]
MEYTSTAASETRSIGNDLAKSLHGGDILVLYGDLGAGKTTLVKGIAEGLGVKEDVTSPTFTLMNVYGIQNEEFRMKNLIHIDTYRLKDEQELINIGAEDYLGTPDTICIIEWPEKIEGLLKDKKIKKIRIEHVDENKRKIIM